MAVVLRCGINIDFLTMDVQAIQDSRLLDLPLAPAFFRRALGQPLSLYELIQIDPELGQQLQELARISNKYEQAKKANKGVVDPSDFTFNGATIADLCLDFTCPGYPEYELVEGGSSKVLAW